MKRLILVIVLMSAVTGVFAITPDEIIEKADEAFKLKRLYSESNIQISRGGKDLPLQSVVSYSTNVDGTNYSLSVYKSPKKMKGNANLMIGNDLWVKFATTGRVRKLSSSAKKNSSGGSDFSYVDMGSGGEGMSFNFSVSLLGEKTINSMMCYEMEFLPTDVNESGYEKLIVYVAKDDMRYIKIDYFKNSANIKTLTFSDYQLENNIMYPFLLTMTNHSKDSITTIVTTLLEFDSEKVKDNIFSQSYLKKLR